MQNFQKSEDKLKTLGVGKIALIKDWLEKYGIKNYDITEDLIINCSRSVNIEGAGLTEFPNYIQFGKINGDFNCSRNNLTSLKGGPTYVLMSFNCGLNKLKDLHYAPSFIGSHFSCAYNQLTSLDDAPINVGANTWLTYNYLNYETIENYKRKKEKLSQAPTYSEPQHILTEVIDETFIQGDNKLKHLGIGKIEAIQNWLSKYHITDYIINEDFTIDIPHEINLRLRKTGDYPSYIQFGKIQGGFDCSKCNLTTLRGCPTYVDKFFFCEYNKLKNLDYAPKFIGGTFSCADNDITDLNSFDSTIIGNTWLSRNLLSEKEIFKYENRLHKNNTNHGVHTNDQRNKSDKLYLDESFSKGGDKLNNIGIGKKEIIK